MRGSMATETRWPSGTTSSSGSLRRDHARAVPTRRPRTGGGPGAGAAGAPGAAADAAWLDTTRRPRLRTRPRTRTLSVHRQLFGRPRLVGSAGGGRRRRTRRGAAAARSAHEALSRDRRERRERVAGGRDQASRARRLGQARARPGRLSLARAGERAPAQAARPALAIAPAPAAPNARGRPRRRRRHRCRRRRGHGRRTLCPSSVRARARGAAGDAGCPARRLRGRAAPGEATSSAAAVSELRPLVAPGRPAPRDRRPRRSVGGGAAPPRPTSQLVAGLALHPRRSAEHGLPGSTGGRHDRPPSARSRVPLFSRLAPLPRGRSHRGPTRCGSSSATCSRTRS